MSGGTPFIIGPAEREALKALHELAIAHPVDIARLMPRLKQSAHKRRHMQQMSRQSVELPFGYLVTFSIETNHPGGRTGRHLSMSSPAAGRVPRPQAVWMVAEYLGFTGLDLDGEEPPPLSRIWLEDLKGHGKAVNLVQLIDSGAEGRA